MKAKYYNVPVFGCVEPELSIPYDTPAERDEAAKKVHAEQGDEDALFWLDVDENGIPKIGAFTNTDFDEEEAEECARCGSVIDGEGFCTDETCPFNDHKQECMVGWSGHPEKDPPPRGQGDGAGPCSICTCGGREDEERTLDIRYRCPDCGHTWEEQYSAACDSECPNCGTQDISALQWKEADDEWTPAHEKEWAGCDKCTCGHDRDDHPHHMDGDEMVIDPYVGDGSTCDGYQVDMSMYN